MSHVSQRDDPHLQRGLAVEHDTLSTWETPGGPSETGGDARQRHEQNYMLKGAAGCLQEHVPHATFESTT